MTVITLHDDNTVTEPCSGRREAGVPLSVTVIPLPTTREVEVVSKALCCHVNDGICRHSFCTSAEYRVRARIAISALRRLDNAQ